MPRKPPTPPTDARRTVKIQISLRALEVNHLDMLCDRMGLTRSQLIAAELHHISPETPWVRERIDEQRAMDVTSLSGIERIVKRCKRQVDASRQLLSLEAPPKD